MPARSGLTTKKRTDWDVVVLGGGLAGLTAALQLKRKRPATNIAVLEKRSHPAPETAFKVGESVAEIGAHYLKNSVDLDAHLQESQLRKMSLRIFSSANGNDDIALRPEIGLTRFSPLRTYQIDRGRLENHLAAEVSDAGVEFLDEHSVSDVSLGDNRHSVTARRNGTKLELDAKWVIDASGRAGVLRRKLGLGVEIAHDVNAAWFRMDRGLVIDDWSDDPHWQGRVPSRTRWMSTNHLVGEGYWVWLIPLPSGAMSIGVVADPDFVGFERIRRYDTLLEWLWEYEPQLAHLLPTEESGLMDFHKLKDYSYGCRRGLSLNRWCLTGEAALFLDPLYSTGVDFIATANTLSTELISKALDGAEDVRQSLRAYNRYYIGQFAGWLPAFAKQYEIFRDPQTTAAKIIWDNAQYFMLPVLLFTKDCITDHRFMASVQDALQSVHLLNVHTQACLRELSGDEYDIRSAGFPVGSNAIIEDLFQTAGRDLTKDEVGDLIRVNTGRLYALSTELLTTLYEACDRPVPPFAQASAPAAAEEQLLYWADYSRRTTHPSLVAPQPDTWMIC